MGAKKPSRAATLRLAKEVRDCAATPAVLSASTELMLSQYCPAHVAQEHWLAARPVFIDVMRRCGITGEASFRKHLGVVASFLGWLAAQSRSLVVSDAFTFAVLDQFYLHGLKGMADKTRNDYRSRLRNVAKQVNPGITSPISASAGHQSVKPGYPSGDEAAIIRTALRQRNVEVRRRLCAVVGLSGGAGLDAADFRGLQRCMVDDRGEGGIFVSVKGTKERVVVVRRDYEELVRIGVAGLKADALVIGTGKSDRSAASKVIDQAEVFDDVVAIEVARLRSTWISWLMCQRVPLRVLLQAAGLRSARTVSDLLPTLPAVPGDDAWLRDGGVS